MCRRHDRWLPTDYEPERVQLVSLKVLNETNKEEHMIYFWTASIAVH